MPKRSTCCGPSFGFRGIHRTIAVRGDQVLVDVHYGLQAAFDWDDDPPGSAEIHLSRLKLKKGQRIAYLFDFGDEWRVRLTVRHIIADDGEPYPRVLESVGDAPPQYPDYEDVEEVA